MDDVQARLKGRCWVVGGAVRDALVGRTAGDRDWVVVGSTPQDMLAAGFRPVGRDFPVFLHPHTHEEYALARTERKSAPGYHGFTFHAAPDVTLEQDLARRDLTVNAMARADDGTLIDPYGGANDLAAGVLRHVSPAFAEDPVRLLRLARFAARWPHFSVAPETQVLLRRLVDDGEVDALVPERVWQELSRGLMEVQPSRMLAVLADCGALPRLLPGVLLTPALLQLLDTCAEAGTPLTVRYAALAGGQDALSERLKVPTDCRDLAVMWGRESCAVPEAPRWAADEMLALFDRCDAWRRPQRFGDLLQACTCEAVVRGHPSGQPWPPAVGLAAALARAGAVDTASLAAAAAAAGQRGPAIGATIRAARLQAMARP